MHTIVESMTGKISTETAVLVRSARQKVGLNQSNFGKMIDRSQAVVSKYEAGTVQPPGDVIMHCINILKPRFAASLATEGDAQWAAVARAMAQLDAALAAVRA